MKENLESYQQSFKN